MNASIFSFIMIAICGTGIATVIYIALVRGTVVKFLYKMGVFKKRVVLDEHEKDIS